MNPFKEGEDSGALKPGDVFKPLPTSKPDTVLTCPDCGSSGPAVAKDITPGDGRICSNCLYLSRVGMDFKLRKLTPDELSHARKSGIMDKLKRVMELRIRIRKNSPKDPGLN